MILQNDEFSLTKFLEDFEQGSKIKLISMIQTNFYLIESLDPLCGELEVVLSKVINIVRIAMECYVFQREAPKREACGESLVLNTKFWREFKKSLFEFLELKVKIRESEIQHLRQNIVLLEQSSVVLTFETCRDLFSSGQKYKEVLQKVFLKLEPRVPCIDFGRYAMVVNANNNSTNKDLNLFLSELVCEK